MTAARRRIPVSAIVACSFALVAHPATAQLPPGVEAPKPTVPEIFTLMGQYVRIARGRTKEHADTPHLIGLLRTRG